MDLNFEITQEDNRQVDTSLLINIFAAQQAGIHILIKMLAVDEKEEAHYRAEFDRLRNMYANNQLEHIYKEHAIVNTEEFLNNK